MRETIESFVADRMRYVRWLESKLNSDLDSYLTEWYESEIVKTMETVRKLESQLEEYD